MKTAIGNHIMKNKPETWTHVYRKLIIVLDCHLNKLSEEKALFSSCNKLQKKMSQSRNRCLPKKRRRDNKKKLQIRKSEKEMENASYYIENGLCKVYPYTYEFKRHAKARWVNTKIWDLMREEFGFYGSEAMRMENMFTDGQLTVNNERVSPDYVIKHDDLICNTVHRHENPILAAPVEILCDNEDRLVVNKPPSWPVHPCGGYRHNCLTHILQARHGYDNLAVCHRLDRLTSGVIFLSKTTEESRKFKKLMTELKLQKEYVCRVEGMFPEGETSCGQPIACIPHKLGLMVAHPRGKPCLTHFTRLSYNGSTSVVKCRPVTGRTHQIRVHLQFLGHPITNDPLYNHPAWGAAGGRGGHYPPDLLQVCDRINLTHIYTSTQGNVLYDDKFGVSENLPLNLHKDSISNISVHDIEDMQKKSIDTSYDSLPPLDQSLPPFDKSKFTIQKNCPVCRTTIAEPSRRQMIMFLHALSLKGPDWQYQTPLPVWAHPRWGGQGPGYTSGYF